MRFLAPFVIRPKKDSSSLGNSAMTFAAAVESNEFWNAKYNKNYCDGVFGSNSMQSLKKIAKKSAAIFFSTKENLEKTEKLCSL